VRILTSLARFNAAHPWSHNDAYAAFVLRNAKAVRRRGGVSALDVGCGTGNLVERLSAIFPHVIGIELDVDVAAAAAHRFEMTDAVTIQQRPFGGEAEGAYDLIVFVASLHHMRLEDALLDARASLRTGGRIVIVGVASETRSDRLRSAASLVLNPLVGFIRHPRRAPATPLHMQAPTVDARQTFDQIQAVAHRLLPSIRMRRRLFWRYTAVWEDPR